MSVSSGELEVKVENASTTVPEDSPVLVQLHALPPTQVPSNISPYLSTNSMGPLYSNNSGVLRNLNLNSKSTNISKDNYCSNCLTLTCIVTLGLAIVGCCISYLVFGIKFLVEDKDINDYCDSEIWIYVLTMVIITFLNIGTTSKAKDKNSGAPLFIFCGMLNLGLGIWGVILFTSTTCNSLINSGIYTWTQVASIFTTIIGGLYLISGILMCMCK